MSLIGKRSIPFMCKIGQRTQVRHGTSIPVILTKDVDSRGNEGEVVNVKRGFARNYLIPRKMAVYATKENKTKFVKSSDVKPLSFQLDISRDDKYELSLGNSRSVTPSDIRRTLEAKGLVIDKRAIIAIATPIVSAGEYTVKVGDADIKVSVTA